MSTLRATPRSPSNSPDPRWIEVNEAARLMGCHRFTAVRRLRPYIVKKVRGGRIRNFVMASRLTLGAMREGNPGEISPEIQELRGQIREVERAQKNLASAQVKLARAVAKIAHSVGVRL